MNTQAPVASAIARSSSFYAGMRVLPPAQRAAMYAIYAFCRAVDDVADEGGERAERQAELARWRADVDAMYQGKVAPRLADLASHIVTYHLQRADMQAIIDGMEMDAVADIRAPDWATLDLYCDRVASAVGRLSVRVFGMAEAPGIALSHHLGRALQLTNILRDIDEDAAIDRLYLPREALLAAGILNDDPKSATADRDLDAACAPVIARARAHFAEAAAIIASAPRQATRAPRLMGAYYGAVLDALEKRGFAPPRLRPRLRKRDKLLILLQHGWR